MVDFGKKTVYVDTNQFVYARASQFFEKRYRKLNYYKMGRECIGVLRACQKTKVIVLSSMISRIELQALHLDWSNRKRLIELGLPAGFSLGEPRAEYTRTVQKLFTRAEKAAIYEELVRWFSSWRFSALVRWVDPSDIRHWGELTEVVLRYMPRAHIPDALHLGAAIGLECTKFLTTDTELKSIIRSMQQDKQLRRELERDGLVSKGYGLPEPITNSKELLKV